MTEGQSDSFQLGFMVFFWFLNDLLLISSRLCFVTLYEGPLKWFDNTNVLTLSVCNKS